MRIGDITLEHGIFLAPMAGVSDLPFRLSLPGTGM